MQASSSLDILKQKLLDCQAVKFGDFTLTSGKKSKFYVDMKLASTDPEILGLIAKEFAKNIKGKNNNIINIIDQRVFKLTPFFFSYTISKTGLYTLTKTSAISLAPKIRVNGIAPGPTLKNKRQSEKHFKKQYLATPLKRQVGVEQICNAVDFFIKNISITGQVLAIDRGQNLNWQTLDVMGKE
mgnify:CR=1 FL=1